MNLTITNDPNQYQTVKAVDEDGNRYEYSPVTDTITVTTPGGHASTSYTAQDALDGALAQREAARKSYAPQIVEMKFPADITSGDVEYWSARAAKIEGCPIIVVSK